MPYSIPPPAQEWNHVGTVVILAQDLERKVDWWRPLMDKIVYAVLSAYHVGKSGVFAREYRIG